MQQTFGIKRLEKEGASAPLNRILSHMNVCCTTHHDYRDIQVLSPDVFEYSKPVRSHAQVHIQHHRTERHQPEFVDRFPAVRCHY